MSIYNLSFPINVQANIQTTLDSIMTNLEGRKCVLYFPPIPTPVSGTQSINPPIGSDISQNIWSAGMPQPMFSQQGFDPYANGTPYVEIEQSETITMIVYPNPGKFSHIFPMGERKADGLIVTRGFVTDLNKVLNCTRMETMIELGTDHYKYKLEGEPTFPSTIIQNRWFYAMWRRL